MSERHSSDASSPDRTVKKIDSSHAPKGDMGQVYLVSGKSISMRMWHDQQPTEEKPYRTREYETVGYVIEGKAELLIEDQKVLLQRGDSWVVPKGARHTYRIIEPFSAIEATSPPAHVHGRDNQVQTH